MYSWSTIVVVVYKLLLDSTCWWCSFCAKLGSTRETLCSPWCEKNPHILKCHSIPLSILHYFHYSSIKTHAWLHLLIESIYFWISSQNQTHTHVLTAASVTFSSLCPSYSTFSLTFILPPSFSDSLSLSQSTEFSGNPSQSLRRPFTLRGTFSPLVAPRTSIHFSFSPTRSLKPASARLLFPFLRWKTDRNNFFNTFNNIIFSLGLSWP